MQHSILCPGHATAPPPHPCARRHVCACACPSGASSSSSSSSSGRGSFRGTHVPNGTNDSGRRALLASGASALLLAPVVQLVSQAPPAEAAVTLNIKSKARLRPANIKAGYLISIPDSFSVAYDRSDGQDAGTAFFCGNFKTFETISISRTPLADLGLQQLEGVKYGSLGPLSLEEVVEKLLADTRDNQSTFGFKVLAAQRQPPQQQPPDYASPSSAAAAPAAPAGADAGGAFWDVEYVHQICRGIISEESGGRRRCVSVSGDRDLLVVSRHYIASFTIRGPNLYVAKASAPSEAWANSAALLLASVHSFALPPAV